MVTGLLHVTPPSVDLENIIVAGRLAQIPDPPSVHRIQDTYTVPSLPMARSLNWSTTGTVWVVLGNERVHVVRLPGGRDAAMGVRERRAPVVRDVDAREIAAVVVVGGGGDLVRVRRVRRDGRLVRGLGADRRRLDVPQDRDRRRGGRGRV